MANGKTVLLASQAPTTECYGLNLERSDTSGMTLGSCSEHKGEKVVPLLTAQVLARVRRISIGESRSCCQASSLKSLEGGSCESGVGTYLRVCILRDTWKMKVSVWTGCFVFMIFYFGFCSAFLIKNFCILPLTLESGKLDVWLMWRVGPSAVLLSRRPCQPVLELKGCYRWWVWFWFWTKIKAKKLGSCSLVTTKGACGSSYFVCGCWAVLQTRR